MSSKFFVFMLSATWMTGKSAGMTGGNVTSLKT